MNRHLAAAALLAALSNPALAGPPDPADPLASVMWDVLRPELFGTAPVQFDDRVIVTAPDNAENAAAVPVMADATALGAVEEMVLFADLNPFPVILRFQPLAAKPVIATRFKVQQATPLRAAARTPDGVWHIGGKLLDAAGGGCTAPPATYAAADWADHVGEVQGRAWAPSGQGAGEDKATRVRFLVRHPMDTGLVAGIPAYFIEALTLRDADGRALARLQTAEPLSENPVFTLEVQPAAGGRSLTLDGRDNQGGEVKAAIPLPWVQGALP
ncbi:quinoprotein dehydrogenase-associated SoxYZ-like carrier [Azospirillum sp. Vi22]|uniref:quinoprotein dehydrogenase-associated SoxYZ-like carrier n=1 Tax=Azospirillum baldaniorum TaxID=1064539 RepID=UPI00157AF276|nr:quinoprotein dehydrogenase-associated SoxYZ-like carrier [Azospirillum baldaniorum]NUB09244.1 quinoprotein dehydrogenase-associated SoxYZ-like carrier [Azospirillum baldaniorum]